MRIFIVCSKHFYCRIPDIQRELEAQGHNITFPNSYENPFKEEEMKLQGKEAHVAWKSAMMKKDDETVSRNDALLVLNFDKNGQQNYIGGATYGEILTAFKMGKPIYLYNPIPDNIFKDELVGMNPAVIHGDLFQIVERSA